MKKHATLLVICLVWAAGSAGAAPAEPLADKKVLTLDGAKAVATAATALARAKGAGGAIAVVDDGGSLLYLERIDGTFAAAAAISIEKARTAAVFKLPTKLFEEAIQNGRVSFVANREALPLQGGVPIVVEGQVVGAVGVSGAMNAQQDQEIALAAAAALQ